MKKSVGIAVLLAALVVTGRASAVLPAAPGCIGLLDILAGQPYREHNPRLIRPYVLQQAPSESVPVVAEITRFRDLEILEWGYEQPGAVVYGYHYDGERSWYEVRLSEKGKRGWIKGRENTTFHSLSALLSQSLAYLTTHWDRQVYGAVGEPSTATRVDASDHRTPVMVAGSAMLEEQLWVLVVVLKESPCASSAAPAVLTAGWVPAHAGNGKMNIWFYSRGC